MLALLVVWLGYVLRVQPADHQVVRLTNGAVVELLGYSFGKQHELRMGRLSMTLRDLPDLLRPAPIVRSAATDRDALLLWVRVPNRLTLHPGWGTFLGDAKDSKGYYFPSDTDVQVKYLAGNPYGAMQFGSPGLEPPTIHREDILAVPLTCYPQRESRFAVDIFEYGGNQPLATFQIAKPNAGHPAPFVAEPLPATRRQQDLQVTLTSITPNLNRMYVLPNGTGAWWHGYGEPKDGVLLPGQEGRQRVSLSYKYRRKPDLNWKISELDAFDAMGNRTHEIAPAPSWPCRTYFPPSSGEPYKLRIGVTKTLNCHFEGDELWTVSDIPLPTNGKPVAIRGEFSRDDLHLQLISVRGTDGKNFNKDLAIVKIKVETALSNPVLLLHAEDEHGRTLGSPSVEVDRLYGAGNTSIIIGNLDVYQAGFYGDNDPKYRSVPLNIPKGVKHIKLFFKLPRTHFFEFGVPAYRHSAS